MTSPRCQIPGGAYPRVRTSWLLVAGGLFGLLLVLLAPAAPAAAHANLHGSDPANGAILSQPPAEVVLTFSEPVRLVPDRIVVIGPDGEPVHDGEPRLDGADVIIPLRDVRDIGTYLVSYRVISQDSHPVGGALTYSLGAPSQVPDLPEAQGDSSAPAVSAAVKINKYVGYAGLVLVIGPTVLLAMLWPHRLRRPAVIRLVRGGLALVAVSTLAGVWLQAPYTTGRGLFTSTFADFREVLATPFGAAHVIRLGVLVSVALLLRPLLTGQAGRSDRWLVGGLAVVGLGTWPFAGHAIAAPIPLISVVAHTVHLASAAFWLGGLVVLAGFLLRLADQSELAVILPEWSRWAAAAVTALLLSGLLLGVSEIGPPEALWTTGYGRLLLVKLALVALVVAVAGYSRRLVRQRLAASRPQAMRLAVAVEAVVLAGVLAFSAVLSQTTPGRTEADAPPPVTSTDFATTLDSRLYSLQVLVDPAQRGGNSIHLTAYSPEGEPLRVAQWQVSAALPAAGVEPIDVPVLALTDNHAFGEVSLPVAGDWEFRFTVRVSEIDQASVEVTVPIR